MDFEPVHPSRTLEDNLPTSAFLGAVEPSLEIKPSVTTEQASAKTGAAMKLNAQLECENAEMSLSELLNLSDIEKYGTSRLPKKSWAYFWSGSDDMISKRWNTTVYQSIVLRPRVFIDVQTVDTTTYLLGHRFDLPIFISPTAMCRLAHPSGEGGIAKSCAANNILQIISNNASQTPEEVAENTVKGQVLGWQLYVQTDASKSEAMMRRINTLRDQYKFLVLTLDAPTPGKREEDDRQKNEATPLALQNLSGMSPRAGTGLGKALFRGTTASLVWKTTLKWICQHTDLPIVLKGIQTHEDAILALSYTPQVQALILSNHGGRGCDTAPSAMHTLLEIRRHSPEVLTRMEVWVDGGIQRGTDVIKALALGAKGVGLGRAALWGLAAGGTAGVDRMISSKFTP